MKEKCIYLRQCSKLSAHVSLHLFLQKELNDSKGLKFALIFKVTEFREQTLCKWWWWGFRRQRKKTADLEVYIWDLRPSKDSKVRTFSILMSLRRKDS